LGVLFRTTTITRQRKELLILLTPQVLANNQTPVALQEPSESTREILDESVLKTQAGSDKMKHRIIDPLFRTNALPLLLSPAPGANLEEQ